MAVAIQNRKRIQTYCNARDLRWSVEVPARHLTDVRHAMAVISLPKQAKFELN